jgi:hypothetical protein
MLTVFKKVPCLVTDVAIVQSYVPPQKHINLKFKGPQERTDKINEKEYTKSIILCKDWEWSQSFNRNNYIYFILMRK